MKGGGNLVSNMITVYLLQQMISFTKKIHKQITSMRQQQDIDQYHQQHQRIVNINAQRRVAFLIRIH